MMEGVFEIIELMLSNRFRLEEFNLETQEEVQVCIVFFYLSDSQAASVKMPIRHFIT
jgi:hypothetical protein